MKSIHAVQVDWPEHHVGFIPNFVFQRLFCFSATLWCEEMLEDHFDF